jgi:hypothetical protein
MRAYSFFLICILLILPSTLPATIIAPPSKTPIVLSSEQQQKLASLKISDVQKLIGRKLTFKEKIGLWLLKHTSNKKTESKKGSTALTFGIVGVVMLILGLVVPYILLGALVAAILAVVLGSNAKKQNPSDRKAETAVILGWITIGGIALVLILAAILLATFSIY